MPTASFTSALSGAIGAFVAAWAGAQLGFRRSKKERALDRVIAWHEEAIQSLALYEEQLERLRKHALNSIIVQRLANGGTAPGADVAQGEELPKLFRPTPETWAALGESEARARASLRLGDLYTEGRVQLECSVGLSNTVNVVASQWLDLDPSPQVPWLDLQSKAFAVGRIRRSLQESLRIVLELDGILASLLGARYRRWRLRRGIKRLQAEIATAT